jgi:hypothetical protein
MSDESVEDVGGHLPLAGKCIFHLSGSPENMVKKVDIAFQFFVDRV